MTNVLVAGGAGYIGSHACKALARAGFTPVTYDNLEHGHEDAVRWGPLVHAEIADRARLDIVLSEFTPAAIMHFAAYTFVGESVSDPGKYYRNNVVGALTLFEAAVAAGVESVVFSSTAAVYGVPDAVPIPESAPKLPINPYGRSKLMMEDILRDFDAAYGLRSVCLRYFNAAGADPDGEAGEDHEPETHRRRRDPASRPVRHRLRHAGRHGRPRLHPRGRSGRRPCPRPRLSARRRGERQLQPGNRQWILGARDHRRGGVQHRP